MADDENGNGNGAPELEEEEKQENGEMMPPEAGNGNGGDDQQAQIVSLLQEVITLLRGTEGTEDMTKQKDEGGVAEVESPNEKDTATPEGGETGGQPLTDIGTTVTTEGELNKENLLIEYAKRDILKDQEIAELKKSLADLDTGNVDAARSQPFPPAQAPPPGAPPLDPGLQQLPGANELEAMQKENIKKALVEGFNGSANAPRDFTQMPAGVN